MAVRVLILISLAVNFCYGACPAGSEAYSGGCYILGRGYMNWFKAFSLCAAEGCYLSYSENSTEQTQINDYASSKGVSDDFWVGLIDQLEEGTWIMTKSATESTNIPWRSGGPTTDTNSNNCAYVHTTGYQLDDGRCTNNKRYVCVCDSI